MFYCLSPVVQGLSLQRLPLMGAEVLGKPAREGGLCDGAVGLLQRQQRRPSHPVSHPHHSRRKGG